MSTADTARVWDDFAAPLRRFIRGRVGDDALADDLLGEAFLRIHQGLASLQAPERLGAWLYRIARNVIADHYRGAAAAAPPAEAAVVPCKDEQEDADEEGRRLARCVRPMIERLDRPYRDALLLTEIEGMSQRAMAQRLGLSVPGAKSRVQRGREQLKSMILQCCHVELDRRGNVVGYRRRGECGCPKSDEVTK